jgi:hypothetical protein
MNAMDLVPISPASPWSIAAAIFSGLSLLTIWYINFVKPRRKSRLLHRATRSHFLVPSAVQHGCDYANQDDKDHTLNELSLPPNSEFTIDLIIRIHAPISFSEIIIGFKGEPEKKPYFIKYYNRYISIGKGREVDPSRETTDDYVDKYFYYHRRQQRSLNAGITFSLAFTMKTRDVGLYPLHLYFVSTEPLGEEFGLFVTVEQQPNIRLVCVDHTHLPCVITPTAFQRRNAEAEQPVASGPAA